MCLEFDVRWFPDQTGGLLNAAVVLLFMLILKYPQLEMAML